MVEIRLAALGAAALAALWWWRVTRAPQTFDQVEGMHHLHTLDQETQDAAYQWLERALLVVSGRPWSIRFTAGLRTAEQQARLYAIGRTLELDRDPVTEADGYSTRSNHQDGRAWDFVLARLDLPDGSGRASAVWIQNAAGLQGTEAGRLYRELGELGESLGLLWGGRWKRPFDVYHLERPEHPARIV